MARDIGRPAGGDLRTAVDTLAERLPVEDLSAGPAPRRPQRVPATTAAP